MSSLKDSKFVDEKNSSDGGVDIVSSENLPSYEEAAVTTGAPTETISPLGYHVDAISVIFLVCLPSFSSYLTTAHSNRPSECQQDDWDGCLHHP